MLLRRRLGATFGELPGRLQTFGLPGGCEERARGTSSRVGEEGQERGDPPADVRVVKLGDDMTPLFVVTPLALFYRMPSVYSVLPLSRYLPIYLSIYLSIYLYLSMYQDTYSSGNIQLPQQIAFHKQRSVI